MSIQLGVLQASAVQEMANIGLGHATTSLSEMTGQSFSISVPNIQAVAPETVMRLCGDSDTISVAVSMPFEGEIDGHTVFVFDWPSAQGLWRMLLGNAPEGPPDVDEMYASVILEVGNILCSSFLRAISDMTSLELHSTPPDVAVDTITTTLGSILVQAEMQGLTALAVETQIFADEKPQVSGNFLCMPSSVGLGVLMDRLGLAEAA